MIAFGSALAGFIALGVPITLALGIAAVAFVAWNDQWMLLAAFPQRMVSGVDQFVLLTVPLFILAGNLMNAGQITDRIIRFCQVLVGRFRGGLGLVNVFSSMLFSGVSGSATADSAALGTVLIPGMKREGYGVEFAAALTAVSSVIGPIIPPSIAMIVFAVLSGTSIASLFLAGVVPGILMGIGLMIYTVIVARVRDYPKEPPASVCEIGSATVGALPVLLLPLIILGGILSGMFTPTEAAAVASAYALVVGLVVYRTLTLKAVARVFYQTCVTTSAILLVVAMASIVSFVFSLGSVPQKAVELILSVSDNKVVILLLITACLLVLGAILEPIGALILTVPILLPLGAQLGLEPLHLGVVVVLNLVIGLATPPVGLCLFIVCSISGLSLARVSWAALPPLAICLLVLLLVTFVPDVALLLPRAFGY